MFWVAAKGNAWEIAKIYAERTLMRMSGPASLSRGRAPADDRGKTCERLSNTGLSGRLRPGSKAFARQVLS
jgi:hypothetical protein